MFLARRLLVLLLLLSPCTLHLTATASWGEVRLESVPPGCWLQLDGPTFVSGSAPLPIAALPEGRYLLIAAGPGIASVRAKIQSNANEELLAVPLVPAGSVFFPPGATHFRSLEYTRGVAFFTSGLTGGIALGYAESGRSEASDKLQLAAEAYNRAVSESDINTARDRVASTNQELDDKTRMRNLWATYLAGVWVSAALETRVTPRPSLSRNGQGVYSLTLPRVNTWSAAWRALLIPGGGQRYLGRNNRSNVSAFSTYGLVAGGLFAYDALLRERRSRDDALRRYSRASSPSELNQHRVDALNAADKANDFNALRWWLFGAAAATHLWSIVDAWQVASYSSSNSQPHASRDADSDVGLTLLPSPDGVQLSLAWRLP